MHRFRRHLFRERRRLAIFVVLVTLASFLIYSDDIGLEFGIKYAALVALGTGVGAGLIALGVLMIAPGWRHALETVGISTFLYSILIVQVPNVSFHEGTHSLAAFVGFLVSAAAVHLLIYGRWSDGILRFANHVERATCITALGRQAVWEATVPAVGRTQEYWDHTVESISAVEDEPNSMTLFHRFPTGMMMEQKVTFDQVNPLKSFRYFYQTVGAKPRGAQSLAMVFEKREPWLALHVRWERSAYPMRLALMHWIDDWGGRAVDLQLARLEETRGLTGEGTGELAPA